eukprot:2460598-Rhodomonas_salina.1
MELDGDVLLGMLKDVADGVFFLHSFQVRRVSSQRCRCSRNRFAHMLRWLNASIRMALSVGNGVHPCIVHGDIKAANILVDSMFRAKVSDLGMAGSKKFAGTPYWMAPELLTGRVGSLVSHHLCQSCKLLALTSVMRRSGTCVDGE